LHLTGSASDADDIAQEALVEAYRHVRHFEGRSQFFTWLYRITMNRALNVQRKKKLRNSVPLDDARVEAALAVDAPDDPRLRLSLRETYATLVHALDALSPSLKSAVVLTSLSGLSYDEAAVVLGTSAGAVAVRIHEARKQLRSALNAADKTPSRPVTARVQRPASKVGSRVSTTSTTKLELAMSLAALL
jgi:RNA polymerase sigma-70 factor (ECF subfamily)